jgi:hypothetical protein
MRHRLSKYINIFCMSKKESKVLRFIWKTGSYESIRVYSLLVFMLILVDYSAICMDDGEPFTQEANIRNCVLQFKDHISDKEESSLSEEESLESIEGNAYPAPDLNLYPQARRIWSKLKYLQPYIRSEGFPFMEALIRQTSGLYLQTRSDRSRLLYQVMHDVSEIFQEMKLDHALCRKSLLYFCRHHGLSKWQKRVHFSVNSKDQGRKRWYL